MLSWDRPGYAGHAHSEVWRAATDTFGQAVLIGTTAATVFSDTVTPGAAYYYWVRHVNIRDLPGPYQGANGVAVATSQDISHVVTALTEQMRQSALVGELTAGIDGAKQRFDTLWAVKAQAGDITAGIGLVANTDGTSQVAVSASQFVVFDPNSAAATLTPLFAIDQGQVVIPKALVETATIQVLHAQTIVADAVRAGIAITTPTLNSAVVNGAELNIGEGGPYAGFHTRITAGGTIFTDFLEASGGRLNNITIEEDCNVKGTIYANRIVGDVTAVHWQSLGYHRWASVPCGSVYHLLSFTVPAANFTRTMITPSVICAGQYCSPLLRFYVNGAQVAHATFTSLVNRGMCTSRVFTLPANTHITVQVNVEAAGCVVGRSVSLYVYEQALSFLYIKA